MRYPIKEGAGVPYGFPAGTKTDKLGNIIGKEVPKVEEPKSEEKKK